MFIQELQKTQLVSRQIATLSTEKKNTLLQKIAKNLDKYRQEILNANKKDIQTGKKNGLGTKLDRLLLTSKRIDGIIDDIKNVINLKDQIKKKIDSSLQPNGLKIKRVRTPLGVVFIIYEARPNVTIDATVLALKSGNALVLKGGSDAINSNRALVKIIHQSLEECKLPKEIVYFVDSTDRTILKKLLKAKGIIDVVIPRGGKGLINFVVKNSLVPVIETGASVVHTYVDEFANLEKAVNIVANAKTRRVSVCNALDVLLIHKSKAKDFLPLLAKRFKELNLQKNIPLVEIRADETSFQILQETDYSFLKPTQTKDFDTEFLDYILAVKVVNSLDETIEHILKHSLKHSEAIITEDIQNAEKFLNEIDAACVYHNTSTAFSDGAQLGIGAEIGISTQKLHTRGPFALEGLTSYKWIIEGNEQVRS
jgi:glutamate-5-semialdehyde dehydrogenase